MTVFFETRDLTKSYPGVKANDGVSFSMKAGTIHALLGENGSGKSTLVKMIYGNVRPDSGKMLLNGEPHDPPNPNFARSRGIAMVFQHFSLFDAMTVAENIALGMQDPPPTHVLSQQIEETARSFGLPLNPEAVVGGLSVGERQRVEIIRCLLQEPKLLIMDEPTSVLTPQEVEILLSTLRRLAESGTTILYISHKLEEVRGLCQHATILRGGRVVSNCDPRTKSARELAEMMVGGAFQAPKRIASEPGQPVLELKGVSTGRTNMFGTQLSGVSLSVRNGEILGVAGIAGNGQDELVSALSGEIDVVGGDILLDGSPVGGKPIGVRRRLGLLVAPEERLGHAAAPDMTLVENAFLTGADRMKLSRHGIIDWAGSRSFAERVVTRFDVRTPGTEAAAGSLSGGNLQKYVVGREILQDPRALVINQPTWGVDAAAAASIRQALLDLAAQGAAVLAVSQDLDELLEISTSIAVLNGGKLSEARAVAEVSRFELGMLMGGAHGMRQADEETHAAA